MPENEEIEAYDLPPRCWSCGVDLTDEGDCFNCSPCLNGERQNEMTENEENDRVWRIFWSTEHQK